MTQASICARCKYARCSGSCTCHADPAKVAPVQQHIDANKCPLDFFRTRAEEAKLIALGIPPQKPADEPGGCGC